MTVFFLHIRYSNVAVHISNGRLTFSEPLPSGSSFCSLKIHNGFLTEPCTVLYMQGRCQKAGWSILTKSAEGWIVWVEPEYLLTVPEELRYGLINSFRGVLDLRTSSGFSGNHYQPKSISYQSTHGHNKQRYKFFFPGVKDQCVPQCISLPNNWYYNVLLSGFIFILELILLIIRINSVVIHCNLSVYC